MIGPDDEIACSIGGHRIGHCILRIKLVFCICHRNLGNRIWF